MFAGGLAPTLLAALLLVVAGPPVDRPPVLAHHERLPAVADASPLVMVPADAMAAMAPTVVASVAGGPLPAVLLAAVVAGTPADHPPVLAYHERPPAVADESPVVMVPADAMASTVLAPVAGGSLPAVLLAPMVAGPPANHPPVLAHHERPAVADASPLVVVPAEAMASTVVAPAVVAPAA